jgi:hypothetical protein
MQSALKFFSWEYYTINLRISRKYPNTKLKRNRILILVIILFFATAGILFAKKYQSNDIHFVSYMV